MSKESISDEQDELREYLVNSPTVQTEYVVYFQQLLEKLSANRKDSETRTEMKALIAICLQYGYDIIWISEIFEDKGELDFLFEILKEDSDDLTDDDLQSIIHKLDHIRAILSRSH